MISKGKRRFLVRVYAMNEFLRKLKHTGHLDVFALAQLNMTGRQKSNPLGRGRMSVRPWVMPSLATPETMAKHREIMDNVMSRYRSND